MGCRDSFALREGDEELILAVTLHVNIIDAASGFDTLRKDDLVVIERIIGIFLLMVHGLDHIEIIFIDK